MRLSMIFFERILKIVAILYFMLAVAFLWLLVTPKGVLFRPDGKVIEYDKNEANDHEIDK